MGDTVTGFFGPTSFLPSLKRKPKDDGTKQELLKQLSEQIGDFSAGKKFAPDTNDRPWEGPWDDEPQDKPKTEPNKKKVIVNKTITKEKETNTEPEKNKRFMEDLGKTTPEVDKKPETPEGDEGGRVQRGPLFSSHPVPCSRRAGSRSPCAVRWRAWPIEFCLPKYRPRPRPPWDSGSG